MDRPFLSEPVWGDTLGRGALASQARHFPRAFGVLFLKMSCRDSHLSSRREVSLLQVVAARTRELNLFFASNALEYELDG